MASVHISQHALPPVALSESAAEEFRRRSRTPSYANSDNQRSASPSLVRFHYEVGVVESKAGVLNLIQVCCEVCYEGTGCCKASVCCDAVCCQLQLSSSAPKASIKMDADQPVKLPQTVATSPASQAGLMSYPITARELMAHVARCCEMCLEDKGTCCKKDCCAVSCCLVHVDMDTQAVKHAKELPIAVADAKIAHSGDSVNKPPPSAIKSMCCSSEAVCCTDKKKRADPSIVEESISDAYGLPSSEKSICDSKIGKSSHSHMHRQPSTENESHKHSASECGGSAAKGLHTHTLGHVSESVSLMKEADALHSSNDEPPVSHADPSVNRHHAAAGDVELVTVKKSCATSDCCAHDVDVHPSALADATSDPSVSSIAISVAPSSTFRMSFQVSGMDCASCSKMVEDRVKRVERVSTVTCSVMTGHTEVMYQLEDSFSSLSSEQAVNHTEEVIKQLTQVIEAMGYKCSLLRSSVVSPNSGQGATSSNFEQTEMQTVRLALAITESSDDVNLKDRFSDTCSKLMQISGVRSASIRLRDSDATLLLFEYQPDIVGARTLVKNAEKLLGQSLTVVNSDEATIDNPGDDLATFWRRRFLACLVFVIPLFVIVYFLPAAGSESGTMRAMHYEITRGLRVSSLLGFLLALPIQVYGGMPLYLSAYRAARYGHKLNIDALVALSTTVAFVYSVATTIATMAGEQLIDDVFFETSAVVLTVILLGRYLESLAKGKAAAALSELARMQIETATLVSTGENEGVQFSNESSLTEVHTELLQQEDVVQVLPGARFPTDGVVVLGSSTVDEAMLTGEARPITKSIGDAVFGSTVNQRGLLHVRVTRVPGENALSAIMQLVRQAQNTTPPIQRIADAAAAYFVPAILVLSIAIFVLWILLAEYKVVSTDLASVTFALKFAIATLVVSCPCAVGLAVPVPVMVASGVGAKLGVLFKSGPALEALHKANAIVFDKTGTLTLGKPSVVQWRNVSSKANSIFWWFVASAESGSEHIWAKAMLEYARKDDSMAALATPSDFEAVSGRGIRCQINGELVLIGNRRWMEEKRISLAAAEPIIADSDRCGEAGCGEPTADCCPPGLESLEHNEDDEDVVKLEQMGASVVYVAIGPNTIAGWVALSDRIRPEAASVIRGLEQMNVEVWVLSGDAQSSVDAVAKQLGIDASRANGHLLPGDKATRIQELQQRAGGQNIVAMIGDGINDAPALTQADIGLTVANGSDVAMGAADVVLMKDHLVLLLHAVELSRSTFKVIKLNLGWAFFYNLLAIPFAVGAFYTLDNVVLPPTFAGLAELLSSIPVILFALALKRFKPTHIVEEQPM